ncbi:hypothetical protein FQN50_009408 [Emmonsiellopsis sp. PD_5]|nr:hypothetical protein FQN50_009408 [Emmonsiellopsis sp. PD_5]
MDSTNYSETGGGGGGFLPSPSPAPSSLLSTSTSPSTLPPLLLPQQRKQPLRPGSAKETAVINYVDTHMLAINRRHAKKFSSAFADDDGDGSRGYESFKEVARDVEGIVDVLWVSGTPSLQIPYLISLAGLVSTYLPDFPFSARATFKLIRKLDAIFASLLIGEDVETGRTLPGFTGTAGSSGGGVVSMTEKVRIKSIAESARIVTVSVQGRGDGGDEEEDEEEDEDDEEGDGYGIGNGYGNGGEFGAELGRWESESGRVYERTIQLLGDELGKQDG